MQTCPIDCKLDTPMALPLSFKLLMDGTEVSVQEKWKQPSTFKKYAEKRD